jgi:hypothetical protein
MERPLVSGSQKDARMYKPLKRNGGKVSGRKTKILMITQSR